MNEPFAIDIELSGNTSGAESKFHGITMINSIIDADKIDGKVVIEIKKINNLVFLLVDGFFYDEFGKMQNNESGKEYNFQSALISYKKKVNFSITSISSK